MPGGSPTAYLLWSILSTLFFAFHLFHLWSYDKFQCLQWNQSGRRPGAFKRFMSVHLPLSFPASTSHPLCQYTYLATLSCLVFFGVAFTFFKFQEGVFPPASPLDHSLTRPRFHDDPRWPESVAPFLPTLRSSLLPVTPVPLEYYSVQNKKWVLPLLLVFSIAWACELSVPQFTFWLFLQNQGPTTRLWFESGEFRFWRWGTLFALIGMPLTTFVSRRQLDSCLAWTLLVGSSASTATSLAFLYVLSRFPAFIRRVKDDGAAPNVVLRLVYFYQLNLGRIIYRFLFSLPLFVLSLDGVQGNFLLMVGGIGAFVSSAITLLIFFPRSLTQELGYNIIAVTKPPSSIDLGRPPVVSDQRPASPKDQVMPIFRVPSGQLSSDSGHDASPDYEPEDPSSAAHPHSLEGNFRMHAWHTHDVETPSSESYVFDQRSRSLVRSRSEGHGMALHPYVRHLVQSFARDSSLIGVLLKGSGISVTNRWEFFYYPRAALP
ncbi:hypothetical protein J3R83DRAFT_2500 [Lanmaoa asiatica]|nr:hypothetical protein J3R83DRAFT_2500 [Lanmaoa asiatica]